MINYITECYTIMDQRNQENHNYYYKQGPYLNSISD